MNNPLNNLPPFHVGQTIVCVKTHGSGRVVKDKTYVVKSISKAACNCKYFIVDIGAREDHDFMFCRECGCTGLKNPSREIAWVPSVYFAPLQQSKFPLMSFTSIKEKEEKQILIEN